jgi:hypothetical protein
MAFGIGFYYICFMQIRQTLCGLSQPSSEHVQNNCTKSSPIVMCTAEATKTVEIKGKQKETAKYNINKNCNRREDILQL